MLAKSSALDSSTPVCRKIFSAVCGIKGVSKTAIDRKAVSKLYIIAINFPLFAGFFPKVHGSFSTMYLFSNIDKFPNSNQGLMQGHIIETGFDFSNRFQCGFMQSRIFLFAIDFRHLAVTILDGHGNGAADQIAQIIGQIGI